MGPLALPYVLLPGASAVGTAWAISDWRLAGAAAAGALGLLFALPGRFPPGVFVIPAIAGIAVAGLVLLPLLLFRPRADVWTRMSVALVTTFALGLWLLVSNPGIA